MKCVRCGSKRCVEIIYGYPSPELFDAVSDGGRLHGKAELGGCCIDEDSKRWSCDKCGHRWGDLLV